MAKGSNEQFYKRLHCHKHNANYGVIVRSHGFLSHGIRTESLTLEAKSIHLRILQDMERLKDLIYRYRREPDGTIVTIKHAAKPFDEGKEI